MGTHRVQRQINGVKDPGRYVGKCQQDYDTWYLQNKQFCRACHNHLKDVTRNESMISIAEFFHWVRTETFKADDENLIDIWDDVTKA